MAPKKGFHLADVRVVPLICNYSICNIYSARVSRGSLGNLSTTSMRQHGQRNHLKKYQQEIEKKAKESVLPPPRVEPLSIQK